MHCQSAKQAVVLQQKFVKITLKPIACVGGGSNALGLFNAFIDEPSVALVGVEPAGEGLDKAGRHAATMTKGKFGQMQGFNCYYLQEDGTPSAVHSIASGLDYPGVGPQHCYLKDVGRGRYETATDQECLEAFLSLSRQEGIIPALESAHAVAYTLRRVKELGSDKRLLVNLSGRGDKDTDFVLSKLTL
ncbi:pyridoxal-phosphate dependent enzyme [Glaesserella parasuis]|nr:pyridoxal-phosphate dependent enzyme [Glaesserella parasuis]MCT8743372.1 pyridoxal-phosphate dependent enzyme [Glaesserella parasuis]